MPLTGIRVLDLSRLLPGPFASQILADYGAEVIKVEDTGAGDYLRDSLPLLDNLGTFFWSINRGKKSIKLDLKSAAGREIFLRLAAGADVVLEGFRPGVMDRLGVGYSVLAEINPGIIYCSLTGYGIDGPYRDRAGHDINYLNYTGISSLTRTPEGKPVILGFQLADVGGGSLWAVIAILLALQARNRTGRGQYCDVSMMDGAFAWTPFELAHWQTRDQRPDSGQQAVLKGGYACYQIYETRDGRYVSLGALEGKFWAGFCRKIGRPDYIQHHMDPAAQSRIIDELNQMFKTRTRDEWVEFFADVDVCFSPLLEYEEAVYNEQLRHRQMLVEVGDGEKQATAMGVPVKLSATPGRTRSTAPAPGQHTVDLLRELGYSESEIEDLKAGKVVV
jgi:crotonobetainyl-CoA:carnitine CoA-transferase CaiB-like acyl-CoA transferase